MTSRSLLHWLWLFVVPLSVAMVIFFTFINPGTPVQGITILWFVTFCPGMSLVPLFQLKHFIIEATLIIAMSLSIDAIVVVISLYSRHWSPFTTLWVLITLCLIGSLLQLRQRLANM
ncbi:MAG: hypothetical protein E6J34_06865 [Chloroflexi bacterium]|nr:MAG: hypothetical protein E6J34_06865 [Chloroflexota bacterium]